MEVKEITPNLNKPVKYKDALYTLTAGIIRRDKDGKLYYQVELQDKCNRSISIANLKEVHI